MVPYPCGGKRVDTFRRVGRIFGVYECTFRCAYKCLYEFFEIDYVCIFGYESVSI